MEICYLNLQDIASRRYIRESQRVRSNVLVVVSALLVVASFFLFFFSGLYVFSSYYFLISAELIGVLTFIFAYVLGNRNMDTFVRVTDDGVEWRYKIWGRTLKVKWNNIKEIETVSGELYFVSSSGSKINMKIKQFGTTTSTRVIEKINENSPFDKVNY